jgi:phosphate transport system substrate-binding protein
MSRPLFVYVKKQHVGVVPGIAEFVAEYVSDKTLGEDGYLGAKGLITLPGAEAEKTRADALAMNVLTIDGLK